MDAKKIVIASEHVLQFILEMARMFENNVNTPAAILIMSALRDQADPNSPTATVSIEPVGPAAASSNVVQQIPSQTPPLTVTQANN